MKTSQKIIAYLKKFGMATTQELADYLEITPRAVRKQIKKLFENSDLAKKGTPPKVYYYLYPAIPQKQKIESERGATITGKRPEFVPENIKEVLNRKYIYISPDGKLVKGFEGFCLWCEKNSQPLAKTAQEYIKMLNTYSKQYKNGFIDATAKLAKTFTTTGLDKLFYLDFYSVPRFGKTKLGQLLLFAKQSQDKKIIKELITLIRKNILKLIKTQKIDAVAFIPPTVKREVQLMKELKKGLDLPVREISIQKIKTEVIIPQKTLSSLKDRVENARHTFVVERFGTYKNILLIDDAVGSGATMNEIGKQIRERFGYPGKLVGLGIVGSLKGFQVISEI